GKPLALTTSVLVEDLELAEVSTSDLIGHYVTINKADYSRVRGKVKQVTEQKLMLDLMKGEKGIETNVLLTVEDENGRGHVGG
ncbi:hypothetical protein AAEH90_21555, partial [Shewanella algae]|uniref:hypothetical protein n=1 Tax=Shewanella algae TaxID=38313 RepID=UPI00313EC60A